MTFILKIISGGQSGADQAGLMSAHDHAIPTGGWCPADYRTNIGNQPLLKRFGLTPTDGPGYSDRTELNVKEADATMIFGLDLSSPGSVLTLQICRLHGKPVFRFDLRKTHELLPQAVDFLMEHRPRVLNIAGNRDAPGSTHIFTSTNLALNAILDLLKERLREERHGKMPP